MQEVMKLGRLLVLALGVCALFAAGCGGRVRLEMGGLGQEHVEPIARNSVAMQCQLRRGLGRIALRCPGIAHPDATVDMVIWGNGRVECIARRDYEDDCPVVVEALLR